MAGEEKEGGRVGIHPLQLFGYGCAFVIGGHKWRQSPISAGCPNIRYDTIRYDTIRKAILTSSIRLTMPPSSDAPMWWNVPP